MLYYNENKVAVGEARLLLASGFAGEINQFNLEQKLQRFEHLTMLNTRVKTNAIHITLTVIKTTKPINTMYRPMALSWKKYWISSM